MSAPRAVAIVGATATGKTEIGEVVAATLGGEIVCADSRQVFAELEIGTGKPTPGERASLPHHLFDALHLGQRASAGWYARTAATTCAAIHARGRLPVLVGGSGLYLRALMTGLSGEPPHDAAIRARLREEAENTGRESLHHRLALVDPETAARLKPRDLQRVSRALEVFEASGKPLSWWHRVQPESAFDADWRVFEIVLDPRTLAERIARRTRAMFDGGIVDETRALVEHGLEAPLRALAAVGYDESLELLSGRIGRAEAEESTNLRTRQLAKRQRTWFRHQVEATRIDASDRDAVAIAREIEHSLQPSIDSPPRTL